MAQITDIYFVNFHFNVSSDTGPRSIATFVTHSRGAGTLVNLDAVKDTARRQILSSRDFEVVKLLAKENIFEYHNRENREPCPLVRDTLDTCTIERVNHGAVFIPDRHANRA